MTGIVVACVAAFVQPPLIVFVAAAVLFIVINTACCTWVDHHWGLWSEGRGKFVEKRLRKMRESRVMRRPVEWIASGSDRKFAYAAILTNAVVAVAAARIIGGTTRRQNACMTGVGLRSPDLPQPSSRCSDGR